MPLVAGIDTSTQSTTVEIRDLDGGRLVGLASAPHPTTTPPVSEQAPAAWWSAFERCWSELGTPQVAAISVAGQQHGMVALDGARGVLRPAKLWNDTESAPDAAWLLGQVAGGATAWADAVGSVPVAAFTITKLSWLHRSEPQVWDRLAHVLLPHDWMTLQLTGELVTDRGDASGTGYWSPQAESYRWDLLGVVDRARDWTSVVPRVLGPLDVAGEWRGAVVAPGTGDNMAAALALGAEQGVAVMSLGTSGTVHTVASSATRDPTGAVAGFADATGRFLPLVCTLNAGKVLDAIRRVIGADLEEFDRLVTGRDSAGVTLLPYLDGERTPDRPTASGWLAGLRSDVDRSAVARAAVEGVVCGLLDGLDELRAQVSDIDRLVLTGGVVRSDAIAGVVAAMCDLPVSRVDLDDAVAAGACLQAAAVLEQSSIESVSRRWQLADLRAVEVDGAPVDGVRDRYRHVRDFTVAADGTL